MCRPYHGLRRIGSTRSQASQAWRGALRFAPGFGRFQAADDIDGDIGGAASTATLPSAKDTQIGNDSVTDGA